MKIKPMTKIRATNIKVDNENTEVMDIFIIDQLSIVKKNQQLRNTSETSNW